MSHLLTLTLALAAIVRVRPCWGRSAAFPETGRPAKAIWPYRRDHGSRRPERRILAGPFIPANVRGWWPRHAGKCQHSFFRPKLVLL